MAEAHISGVRTMNKGKLDPLSVHIESYRYIDLKVYVSTSDPDVWGCADVGWRH